ncbi:MAG: hypothetical protein AAF989_00055 [Planctomycetota bacterium]
MVTQRRNIHRSPFCVVKELFGDNFGNSKVAILLRKMIRNYHNEVISAQFRRHCVVRGTGVGFVGFLGSGRVRGTRTSLARLGSLILSAMYDLMMSSIQMPSVQNRNACRC